jgi:hypothetical protein
VGHGERGGECAGCARHALQPPRGETTSGRATECLRCVGGCVCGHGSQLRCRAQRQRCLQELAVNEKGHPMGDARQWVQSQGIAIGKAF